tara:strand:- start:658 stop:1026 length:369 start_codon:yes stop_codon:yes gene_type:complete
MKYLKQFIIGSSYPALFPFIYAAGKIKDKKYSYYDYTLVAPIWLGAWNVISLIIAEKFKLTSRQRFLMLTLITYSLSIIIVKFILDNAYAYSKEEWNQYYIRLFLKHFILWNIIVYYLEKYI